MAQNNALATNIMEDNSSSITIGANGVVQESKKINKSFSLDKSSLFIIVLLFMFSSKLWDIAWDIGKSLLYIIIIIYLISFVNQDLSDNIKNIIHEFTNINSNSDFITDIFAKILVPVKNIFKIGETNISKIVNEPGQSDSKAAQSDSKAAQSDSKVAQSDNNVEKFETITHTSLYDGSGYLSGGNTKNLSNRSRSSSKNIFT